MNNRRNMVLSMVILALGGVLLSSYSLLHKQGFVSGSFCTINSTFDCDVVNQGPYSDLFGIPIALIGVIGYLFFTVAAVLQLKHPEDCGISLFLLGGCVGGFFFALYLSGIEAFILGAWCIVCLASQAFMTMLMILSVLNYKNVCHV